MHAFKMSSILKGLLLVGTAPIWAPIFFGGLAFILGVTMIGLILHAIFISPIIYLVRRRFPVSLDQVVLFYGELLEEKRHTL